MPLDRTVWTSCIGYPLASVIRWEFECSQVPGPSVENLSSVIRWESGPHVVRWEFGSPHVSGPSVGQGPVPQA